jgi:xanthine dehydrogenase accessory factor
MATVVRVYQSAPRQAGARLVVSAGGELEGSVSGGCIEGDIAFEAAGVLTSGQPRLIETGISDAQAWDAGLTCGGAIEVWVERLDRHVAAWFCNVSERPRECTSITVLDAAPGLPVGTRAVDWRDVVEVAPGGPSLLPVTVSDAARALIDLGHRATAVIQEVVLADGASVRIFLEPWPGAPELVVFGAVHVTQVLVEITLLSSTQSSLTLGQHLRRTIASATLGGWCAVGRKTRLPTGTSRWTDRRTSWC